MSLRQTLNVSLTSELENFISDRIEDGQYANAGDVVRTALKLLRERAEGCAAGWPVGGGECGALIRDHDWSRTPLGRTEGWSAALRITVSNIVHSPVPKVLMWGADHVMLYNDAYRAIAGGNHPQALGGTVQAVWPEIWDFNRDALERGFRGEVMFFRDRPLTLLRNGLPEEVFFDLFFTPIHEDDGHIGGVMCTVIENTEKVRAERRLTEQEADLRSITDAMPVLVSLLDRDYRYRFANRAYAEWFGRPMEDIIGSHVRDLLGADAFEERRNALERAFAGESVAVEMAMPHPDGPRRVETRYVPRRDADGAVSGIHILVLDVEDRARRAEALAVSNRRFRTAMDAVHGILWTNSADGRMVGEQPGWSALTGQTLAEYQDFGWAAAVHPDDAQPTIDAWNAAVADKRMFVFEHRVRHRSGQWRSFAIRGLPMLDERGEITEWVGVHTDITHQRAAEGALREQAEALARQVRHRERAEEQLRQLNETLEARVISEIEERRLAEAKLAQAQKLETVGKLTGGVAHDFNNLLQVVSGNLQLLRKDVAGHERAERRVANALAGVSRGAKLAAQLLAFGRRQALEPRVVNITRLIHGMDDMLRRAIGEAIEVETVFSGGLWNTFIDPAQIENALLNLAINARDAMNGSGRLTIELSNASLDESYTSVHDDLKPGQYVMMAVTDTGSGMTPEIVSRVFEPFFSTKPEGKGSGLGLSMVYGFVKQSGGHVAIYSEPGHGTTIRLYLPRATATEDVAVPVDTGPVVGGTETVLVVEDDAEVRGTVVEMLSDLGYRVLKAVDAVSALSVVESGIPIDLLFTDVVMPGTLKSPELARKARERLPGIAVLFTSGYTQNAIVHGGRLDAGVELLSKPYTREALARRIRHVLANRAQQQLARGRQPLAEGGTGPAANPGSLTGPFASGEERLPVAPAAGHAGEARPGADPDLAGSADEALRPLAFRPPPPPALATVLLVEDDSLIRLSTADILRDGGYEVREAESADEALDWLRNGTADVLVTDLNLPGTSGDTLAARVRAMRPATGVVFATGDAGSITRPTDGARVLNKPFSPEELLDAVAGVCPAAAHARRLSDAVGD
ncbi:PAS domain-containing protein [Rhizosaccharibacter radicis]|uniref:histidine kinase n=1 Tax=Rhizosaccharibacter radicis TaxID=2782605 RepID=A0ABT1W257_9PROT|nr:PAS domain-containing protein [Acetobacteraceae bacterium KSS12]